MVILKNYLSEIVYVFLFFNLIQSCGEDYGGYRRFTPPQQEEQIPPAPVDFKTRLNSILEIEGRQCIGTETTEVGGHGSKCLAGQYLIFIDDINTCDSNGRCTVFEVIPIVGELLDISARTPGISIFSINPLSSVTEAQSNILRSINVSTDINGNGTVFSND